MTRHQGSEDHDVIRFEAPRPQGLEAAASTRYFSRAPHFEEPEGLGAYWQVAVRRRWTVLTAVVVITALAAIAVFRMRPVYRAAARVEIDSEMPQMQSLSDMFQQFPTDQDYLHSQTQVLQADQLAWRTIEQLGLQSEPSFAEPNDPREKSAVLKPRLIDRFKDQVTVDLIPSSRVIRVAFESTDPQLAAKVANGLVDNYIDYNFTEKYNATRQAAGRMEQQLDELKARVEQSQRALVDYQSQHAIAKVNEKQNVVEQRLGELSTDLTKAQTDRMEKEALHALLRADPSQIASVAQNELLQRLQEKFADLSNQHTEALSQYGPNFPRVVRLQKQMDEAESLIQRERQRVLAKIGNDYIAATKRERLLSEEVAKAQNALGNVNKLLVEQNILAGEFESNQKMYQTLLQRLKDATISAGLRSTNVHLVDPAIPPTQPVRPKKIQYISTGALVGLIVGFVLAFAQEGLDSSVKSADEIESLLGITALAMVPVAQSPRNARVAGRNGKMSAIEAVPALAMLRQPRSPLAESFRALRTSIVLSLAESKHHTLLISSPTAGEGKTCTAINLAMVLGQCGMSVLLVDGDLRKPSVASTLGLDGQRGLTTVLSGRHSLEEAIQRFDFLTNVSILGSGPVASSPAELLSSQKLATLMRTVADQFTYVIVDSPPILAVTDASILATLVDGVVLVVVGGATPRRAVTCARRMLEMTGAQVLGVVLNKIDPRNADYYGYYGHKYPYGEPPAGGGGEVGEVEVPAGFEG